MLLFAILRGTLCQSHLADDTAAQAIRMLVIEVLRRLSCELYAGFSIRPSGIVAGLDPVSRRLHIHSPATLGQELHMADHEGGPLWMAMAHS